MTKIGFACFVLVMTSAFVCGPRTAAQDPGAKGPTKESYVVVQIGEELQVAPASEVKAIRAQAKKDHRDALQRHKAARQEAAKAGEKFTAAKPKEASVKVVAKAPTEEAAEEARQKLLAKREKRSGEKTEPLTLLLVGADYRIVPKSAVAQVKKTAAEDYKYAMKRWQAARKEAAKNKEAFEQPKPRKPTVKVIKSGFKSEEDARAHQDKVQAKAKSGS